MLAPGDRVATLTSSVPLGPVGLHAPSGVRMKGFGFRHLVEHAREATGEGTMGDWHRALPAALQGVADPRGVTAVSWIPVEVYFSAVEHLVGVLGGDPRLAIAIGHATARRDINAFFRAAMALASPAAVLTIAGRTWRTYFDRGALVITRRAEGEATGEIQEWPLASAVAIYEVAGTLLAWIDASRAVDARITALDMNGTTLTIRVAWAL